MQLFRITPSLPLLSGILLGIFISGSLTLSLLAFTPIDQIDNVIANGAPALLELSANHIFWQLARVILAGAITLFFLLLIVSIGYLLTATLGIQIQRETIADLSEELSLVRSYLKLFPIALLLTISMVFGLAIAPFSIVTVASISSASFGLGLVCFVMFSWLWLIMLRLLTQVMMGTRAGYNSPTKSKRFVQIVSVILPIILYFPSLLLFSRAIENDFNTASILPPPQGETLFFFETSVAMAIILAFAVLLMVGLATFGFYVRVQDHLVEHCPECCAVTSHTFVVSKRCDDCGLPLAAWVYAYSQPVARIRERE